MNELEFIQYEKLKGMEIFLNNCDYRTPHFHQEWEILWVMSNPLIINCDGTTFEAEEGDLLVFSPSQVHEFKKKTDNCTFLCLQVSSSLMGITDQLVSKSCIVKNYLDPYALTSVRKGLSNLLVSYLKMENMFQINCIGECNRIMYRILSNMPCRVLTEDEKSLMNRKNARLNRLLDYVDKNYMHKVNLGDFAKMENVSLCYLSHFVKNSLNQTFQEYVNSVRYNHAEMLIKEGNMKLSEVCKASGFSDYKYFSATFVKKKGKLPEEYAKEIRDGKYLVKISESSKSTENFFSKDESISFIEDFRKRGLI